MLLVLTTGLKLILCYAEVKLRPDEMERFLEANLSIDKTLDM